MDDLSSWDHESIWAVYLDLTYLAIIGLLPRITGWTVGSFRVKKSVLNMASLPKDFMNNESSHVISRSIEVRDLSWTPREV